MGKHFFKSLEIENFRGIGTSKIDNFARINLFVGKNGCGKTSILESLTLLSKISDPRYIIHIQDFKAIRLTDSKQLSDVFFKQRCENNLRLIGVQKSGKRELKIKVLYEKARSGETRSQTSTQGKESVSKAGTIELDKANDLWGLEYNFSISDNGNRPCGEYSSRIVGNWSDSSNPAGFEFNIDERYDEKLQAEFMLHGGNPPYDFSDVDRMLEEKRKDVLLESLKVVEPKVQDIKVGPTGVVSADIGLESFISVNLLGDGVRHMISVISNVDRMREGILMIDEFGSGLHVSCIEDMWKILIEQSGKLDTQIFMTTHSKDVVEGLAGLHEREPDLFSEDGDDVACFYLGRNSEGRVKGYRYSPEDLKQVLKSDTDIRH